MRMLLVVLNVVACAGGSVEAPESADEAFGEGTLLALPDAAPAEAERVAEVGDETEGEVAVDEAIEEGDALAEVDGLAEVEPSAEPVTAPLGLGRLRTLTRGGCARSPTQLPSLLVATQDGSAWDISCLIDVATEDLARCPCVTPRAWPTASEAACLPVEAATAELRERFGAYASGVLERELGDGAVELCVGV